MKFCAIDIEANQPSGTIIQIGASVWDTQRSEEIDHFNLFIRPGESINWDYPIKGGSTLGKLPPFGQEVIDSCGISTKEALESFWAWSRTGGGRKMVQWGTGDPAQIQKESLAHGVRFPPFVKLLNAKAMYQMLYQPTQRIDLPLPTNPISVTPPPIFTFL